MFIYHLMKILVLNLLPLMVLDREEDTIDCFQHPVLVLYFYPIE
ncbi:hypothetical protein HERIO_2778 [Hepatospora eriocheir]|uniref:Uncharacterized protein n=1 Tax=Hepatospora eriocheir TaxID=1081669 RepID=A0A1X0Q7R5_9MICR|nr:hypothetical protein HERIO_2778 [Hepatospora eriocheir]